MTLAEFTEWLAFQKVAGPMLEERIDYLISLMAYAWWGKNAGKVLPPWIKDARGDGVDAAFAAFAEMAKRNQ